MWYFSGDQNILWPSYIFPGVKTTNPRIYAPWHRLQFQLQFHVSAIQTRQLINASMSFLITVLTLIRSECRLACRMGVVAGWLWVVVVTSLVTCVDVMDSARWRSSFWRSSSSCRQCLLGDRSSCAACSAKVAVGLVPYYARKRSPVSYRVTSFIHSFVHPIHPFIHSFIHPSIHSFSP